MLSSQHFERPRFQNIIQYYLNCQCEMADQVASLDDLGSRATSTISKRVEPLKLSPFLKVPFRVFITEMIPVILVSDGHEFIEAVFTQQCINDYRRNNSNQRFSNLRDKIIQVEQWSLQIEAVDSRKVYNSFKNLSIRLVIEQFTPKPHEELKNLNSGQSIFRNQEVQILIKNFRHWFAQQLIGKCAISKQDAKVEEADSFPTMPSVAEIFVGPEAKKGKSSATGNSQNTTVVSDVEDQRSSVFRCSLRDFEGSGDDQKADLSEFSRQVTLKMEKQIDTSRLYSHERLVIQEKGETYYHSRLSSKSKLWLEKVQDEFRRKEIKDTMKYFQVGTSTLDQLWTKPISRAFVAPRQVRRICGYQLNNSTSLIRTKLLKLLNHGSNPGAISSGTIIPAETKKVFLPFQRPRSNSQENILVQRDEKPIPRKREPLSQFIQGPAPQFNDDTESEQFSEDKEMEAMLSKEKNGQLSDEQRLSETVKAVPITISMFESYLTWFKKHDVTKSSLAEDKGEDTVSLASDEENKTEVFGPDQASQLYQCALQESKKERPRVEARTPKYTLRQRRAPKPAQIDIDMENEEEAENREAPHVEAGAAKGDLEMEPIQESPAELFNAAANDKGPADQMNCGYLLEPLEPVKTESKKRDLVEDDEGEADHDEEALKQKEEEATRDALRKEVEAKQAAEETARKEQLAKQEAEKALQLEQEARAEAERQEKLRLEQEALKKEQEEQARQARLREEAILKKKEELRRRERQEEARREQIRKEKERARQAEKVRLEEEARAARAAQEAKIAEEERLAKEAARIAEETRLHEQALAEEARLAKIEEEKKRAEEARIAKEERLAKEKARLEEELRFAKEEEARQAREAHLAEQARILKEARLAEEAREAEKAKQKEEARLKQEQEHEARKKAEIERRRKEIIRQKMKQQRMSQASPKPEEKPAQKSHIFEPIEKVEEQDDLDWEEGEHIQSKAQEIQELDERHDNYVDSMRKRHLKSFEKGILHNKIKDFGRRSIREERNPDRLHDIWELKALQEQRREEREERREKFLKQRALHAKAEDPELDDLQQQVKIIEKTQDDIQQRMNTLSQGALGELPSKNLTEDQQRCFQQIKAVFGDSVLKSFSQVVRHEPKAEPLEEEEDYALPVFGSQAQNQKKNGQDEGPVSAFRVGERRNFEQFQEENEEANVESFSDLNEDEDDKELARHLGNQNNGESFSNLSEFVQQQRLKKTQDQIQTQRVEKKTHRMDQMNPRMVPRDPRQRSPSVPKRAMSPHRPQHAPGHAPGHVPQHAPHSPQPRMKPHPMIHSSQRPEMREVRRVPQEMMMRQSPSPRAYKPGPPQAGHPMPRGQVITRVVQRQRPMEKAPSPMAHGHMMGGPKRIQVVQQQPPVKYSQSGSPQKMMRNPVPQRIMKKPAPQVINID